jgi:hypothetical protein
MSDAGAHSSTYSSTYASTYSITDTCADGNANICTNSVAVTGAVTGSNTSADVRTDYLFRVAVGCFLEMQPALWHRVQVSDAHDLRRDLRRRLFFERDGCERS